MLRAILKTKSPEITTILMLCAILKTKSPENTTITYYRPTNHTVRKRHGTLTVAWQQEDNKIKQSALSSLAE